MNAVEFLTRDLRHVYAVLFERHDPRMLMNVLARDAVEWLSMHYGSEEATKACNDGLVVDTLDGARIVEIGGGGSDHRPRREIARAEAEIAAAEGMVSRFLDATAEAGLNRQIVGAVLLHAGAQIMQVSYGRATAETIAINGIAAISAEIDGRGRVN
jgi:hypothetical protein